MTILARNVRMPRGEIDLVATDGNDIVFVEVRTRRGAPGMAAESLFGPKLRRMWQCAMDYCEDNDLAPERARIDVIAVELAPNGTVAAVEHFRAIEIPGE